MQVTARHTLCRTNPLQGCKKFESYDFVKVDLLTADNLNAVVGKTLNPSVTASFKDSRSKYYKIAVTVTNSHIYTNHVQAMLKNYFTCCSSIL